MPEHPRSGRMLSRRRDTLLDSLDARQMESID
jgi:hypothetical protein